MEAEADEWAWPTPGQGAGRKRTGLRGLQSRTQTSVHHLPAPPASLGGGVRAAMALRAVVFDLDGVLLLPSVSRTLACTEEQLALPR